MPDYLGADQRKVRDDDKEKDDKPIQSLDEGDIALLKVYGKGPYSALENFSASLARKIRAKN